MPVTPTVSPRVASGSFASPIKRSKSSTNIKSKINQLASKSGTTNTTATTTSSGLGISPVVLASPNSKHTYGGENSSPTSKVHTNKFKFLDQEYLNELTLIIEKNFEAFEDKIFSVLNEYQQQNIKINGVISRDTNSDIVSEADTEEKLYEIKSILLEIVDRSKGNNSSLVSLNENLMKFNDNISKDDSINTLTENLKEILYNLSNFETNIESTSRNLLKEYESIVNDKFTSFAQKISSTHEEKLRDLSDKNTLFYTKVLEEILNQACKQLTTDFKSQTTDPASSLDKEQLADILENKLSSLADELKSLMDTTEIKSQIEKLDPLDKPQLEKVLDEKLTSLAREIKALTNQSELSDQIKDLNPVTESQFKEIIDEKLASLAQELKSSTIDTESLKSHIKSINDKHINSIQDDFKSKFELLHSSFSEATQTKAPAPVFTKEIISELLEEKLSSLYNGVATKSDISDYFESNLRQLLDILNTKFSAKDELLDTEALESSINKSIVSIKESLFSSENKLIQKLEETKEIVLKEITDLVTKSKEVNEPIKLKEVNDSVHAKLDDLLSKIYSNFNKNDDSPTQESIKQETFKLQEIIINSNEESSFLAKSNLEKLNELKNTIEKENESVNEIKRIAVVENHVEEIKSKLGELVQLNEEKSVSVGNEIETKLLELTTLLQNNHNDIKDHTINVKDTVESISKNAVKKEELLSEVTETKKLLQSLSDDKDKEIEHLRSIIESQNSKIREYEEKESIVDSIELLQQTESNLKKEVDNLNEDKTNLLVTLNTISNKFINIKNEITSLSLQKQELINSIESIEKLFSNEESEKSIEQKAALGNLILNNPKQRSKKSKAINSNKSDLDNKENNNELGKKRNFTTGIY